MSTAFASPRNSTVVLNTSLHALLRAYFGTLSRLLPGLAVRQAERLFTRPPRYAGRRSVTVAARRDTVSADGREIAVWQAGPADAPAVLLAHGWGGRAVQMGSFVEPLLARGHRVVWYDQPGHGASGGGAVALPDMLRALEAVVRTHGPFSAAVGHSLGAGVLALALRRGLVLERAVFVAPPASMNEYAHHFARLLGISARVREAMRERLERRYGLRFAEIDRSEELAQVRIPALFVHDAADPDVPFEHSQRLTARMPTARLIRTWGLGHHRILRDHGVVSAAAAFIGGQEHALPAELPRLPEPAPLY